ncbi:sensor histidine kinase [Oceanispirochaeta sp.]|jgi:two-component sensor histidine kinase|uniref:sensor histidine kinase n=1 Tax=Oceanispirochaeta sp. TaxID=2035350 RepID=UPI0026168ADF|nr:sensor histidine kinase [Oceanispirochaeta sp.]MDA3958049.1 sensor histidine kinase [Oceanispirochaeta sp.]
MISKQNPKSYLSPFDKLINSVLNRIVKDFRIGTLLLSLLLYINILLFFGEFLKISCNYFILLPMITISFIFGLPGGFLIGTLALPLNLLMFFLMDHMEYLPENLYIAEIAGILVGIILGYQSEYFSKLNREIEIRISMENRLRISLSDKDILLKEVNHRVRNNLNIITSLIQLHSNNVNHPVFTAECRKLKERIFSISLIHEQLFLENQPLVLDLTHYMDKLMDNLVYSMKGQDVRLIKQWPDHPMPFSSERVQYLGLILHEVVMNSLKHGFLPDHNAELTISLDEKENNSYSLHITDNGPGFDLDKSENGLGLRLVDTLSQHLNGRIRWENVNGCSFHLNFSKK